MPDFNGSPIAYLFSLDRGGDSETRKYIKTQDGKIYYRKDIDNSFDPVTTSYHMLTQNGGNYDESVVEDQEIIDLINNYDNFETPYVYNKHLTLRKSQDFYAGLFNEGYNNPNREKDMQNYRYLTGNISEQEYSDYLHKDLNLPTLQTSQAAVLAVKEETPVQNSTQFDIPDYSLQFNDKATKELTNFSSLSIELPEESKVPIELQGNQFKTDWGGAVSSFASTLTSGLSGLEASLGQRITNAGSSIYKSAQNLKSINNLVAKAKEAGQTVKGAGTAKAGNIAAIGGAVADLAGSFLPDKTEYNGPKGDITKTMDTILDGLSDAAMMFGPIGMIVGASLKGANLLSKGINSLGGGTDSMTTTDAILGNSLLSLTPFGLINGFGGKKADTITKNDEAFETVGASYTGSNLAVNDALLKSGKKYGAFSSGARKKANQEIAEAKRQQSVISDISDLTTDRFSIQSAMAAINGNGRAFNMQGGYDQGSIRVGRQGLKVDARVRNIVKKCLQGSKVVDPFQEYLNTLPENLRDTTNYRARDFWEYNGKPKDFEEAKSRNMFTLLEDGWHAPSVAENPETGEIEFMKSSSHPTHYKEVEWYNSDDGAEFRSQYGLIKSEPYWKYVRRKTPMKKEGGAIEVKYTEIQLTKELPEFQEGGSIKVQPSIIELVEEVPEFQNGGSINVIPDGALHARKHNMDIDGITKKGIPVVSEKDGGELELQAEIEKEEIIFRLEVTKKIEELCSTYYSEDSSSKEKEEAALEAGKLLANEILNNTVDNTNNLL